MTIKNIVWPTDFSEAAAAAEPYVISLSQKYGAEVHLLYVAEDLTALEHYWGSGLDPKHLQELQGFITRAARERLEDLCRSRLTQCPRYCTHILVGDAAHEILRAIEEIGADLVIMATHGMKANFPYGSVTERVVKNSPVPVLTVSPPIREKSRPR